MHVGGWHYYEWAHVHTHGGFHSMCFVTVFGSEPLITVAGF